MCFRSSFFTVASAGSRRRSEKTTPDPKHGIPLRRRLFPRRGLRDLPRADAPRAGLNLLGSALDDRVHALQIDVPLAIAHVVSVADAVAAHRRLPAELAMLRHGSPRVSGHSGREKLAEPISVQNTTQERTAVRDRRHLSDRHKSLQEVRFASLDRLTTQKPFAKLATSRNTKGKSP